ncbi:phosphoenolpyruvate-protein phosphotransferase [Clostridia bacterium]|nr:phosphoenolpyruvate-protein phosphotransferase [Clostridia bacterium]
MEKFEGKSIYNGVSIGTVLFYGKADSNVKRRTIGEGEIEAEIERFEAARIKAQEQIHGLYEQALKKVGENEAAIFEVHEMLLDDDDFIDTIVDIIKTQKVNAEYAAAVTGDNFSKTFSSLPESDYMHGRAADILDISGRVVSVLLGVSREPNFEYPVIVVADDLVPSETVQMDKEKLLGFALQSGSTNSHTAILARTMNIPAITGIRISPAWSGRTAIIDGFGGAFYIDPDLETIDKFKKVQEREAEKRLLLLELKGKDDQTKSGRKIRLYANIASVGDLAAVLANDAKGIGLFRSEFLYLESDNYPSEDAQFKAYKQVAETMSGKKVIIRTLDIGADKQADYFNIPKEENPAMGYRAIRICLDRVDVFKTQLRALFRASAFGNIAVMYPMIISVDEVRKIKLIVKEVKDELDSHNIKYGNVEQGIMIETPAAVIISDLLAKEVDFFSIGTNDLTQYTLAVDRQNRKIDALCDTHHPAVLRMIQTVVDNAHENGIWAGICGELGADLTLTTKFVEMGVDELSVSPSFVLPIRKIIREIE